MADPESEKTGVTSQAGTGIIQMEAIRSPDPHIRGHSVYMLGVLKDPTHKGILLSAIRDEDKGVRAQAAEALAGLGGDAVPDLISLLGESDWRIRYRAAEALGKIRLFEAVEPLTRALSDEKDHVRYMAAKSLGFLGAGDAVPDLVRLLSDENEYVRRMVVLSLGKIGEKEGTDAILRIRDNETCDRVKDAIRTALEDQGKKEQFTGFSSR